MGNFTYYVQIQHFEATFSIGCSEDSRVPPIQLIPLLFLFNFGHIWLCSRIIPGGLGVPGIEPKSVSIMKRTLALHVMSAPATCFFLFNMLK